MRQERITEILVKHQDLIHISMIEHKNHLDNYPTTTSNEDMSNAIREDLQKLDKNKLRVKQFNIIL